MLKLGTDLAIKHGSIKIVGRVIGIDKYELENFEGKSHNWFSYTLTSSQGGLFKRYWLTDWKKHGWHLWVTSKKIKNLKFKKVIQDRSGIAHITFTGDRGVSSPYAALVIYELEANEYYSTERFVSSDAMYFRAHKVAKPIGIAKKA